MKNSLTTIIIGIIIIVAVAWFALRNDDRDSIVLAPTIPPTIENDLSGFMQIAPSDVPVVSTSPEISPAVASEFTVSLEDEGFIPASLTVKVGTKVNFINNGQALHWIASDPHPIHTGLAGLDSKKGLSTGESYSLTFEKAGTFGIHDHLNTKIKGTIIVQ